MWALQHQLERLQSALQAIDVTRAATLLSPSDVAVLQTALAHTEALVRRMPTTATSAAASPSLPANRVADTLASVSAQTGIPMADIRACNPQLTRMPQDAPLPANTFLKLRAPAAAAGVAETTAAKDRPSPNTPHAAASLGPGGNSAASPPRERSEAMGGSRRPSRHGLGGTRSGGDVRKTEVSFSPPPPPPQAAVSPCRDRPAAAAVVAPSPLPLTSTAGSPMRGGSGVASQYEDSPLHARSPNNFFGSTPGSSRGGSWEPESSSPNASAFSAPPPCAPMPTTATADGLRSEPHADARGPSRSPSQPVPFASETPVAAAASGEVSPPVSTNDSQSPPRPPAPLDTDARATRTAALSRSPPSPLPQPPPPPIRSGTALGQAGRKAGSPPLSRRPKAAARHMATSAAQTAAPPGEAHTVARADGAAGISPLRSPVSPNSAAAGPSGTIAVVTTRGRGGSQSPPRIHPLQRPEDASPPLTSERAASPSAPQSHSGSNCSTSSSVAWRDAGRVRAAQLADGPGDTLPAPRGTSGALSEVSAPSPSASAPRASEQTGPSPLAPSPVETRAIYATDPEQGEGVEKDARGAPVSLGDDSQRRGREVRQALLEDGEDGHEGTVSVSVSKDRADGVDGPFTPSSAAAAGATNPSPRQVGSPEPSTATSPPNSNSATTPSPDEYTTRLRGGSGGKAADTREADDDGDDSEEESEDASDALREEAPTPCSAVPASLAGFYYANNPAPSLRHQGPGKEKRPAEPASDEPTARPPGGPGRHVVSAGEEEKARTAANEASLTSSHDASMANSSTFLSEPPTFQDTSPAPQRQRPTVESSVPPSQSSAIAGEEEGPSPAFYTLKDDSRTSSLGKQPLRETPDRPSRPQQHEHQQHPVHTPTSECHSDSPRSTPPPVLGGASPSSASRSRILERYRQRSHSAPLAAVSHGVASDSSGDHDEGMNASHTVAEPVRAHASEAGVNATERDDDAADDDGGASGREAFAESEDEYDTIASIAEVYGVPVELVVKWNPYLAVYGADDPLPPDLPIVLPMPGAEPQEGEEHKEDDGELTAERSDESWVEEAPASSPSSRPAR